MYIIKQSDAQQLYIKLSLLIVHGVSMYSLSVVIITSNKVCFYCSSPPTNADMKLTLLFLATMMAVATIAEEGIEINSMGGGARG